MNDEYDPTPKGDSAQDIIGYEKGSMMDLGNQIKKLSKDLPDYEEWQDLDEARIEHDLQDDYAHHLEIEAERFGDRE